MAAVPAVVIQTDINIPITGMKCKKRKLKNRPKTETEAVCPKEYMDRTASALRLEPGFRTVGERKYQPLVEGGEGWQFYQSAFAGYNVFCGIMPVLLHECSV